MGAKTWNAGDVLTAADLNKYGEGIWGVYSATTDASSTITFNHGAPWTPSFVVAMGSAPNTGANRGVPLVSGLTSTTVSLTYQAVAGSMATVAVTGYFLVLP